MTLYGKIVDGELVDVGNLPSSARRLSTNQIVYDLGGEGALWARDCGWFDLDTFDPAELELDDTQRQALEQQVTAATSLSDQIAAFIASFQDGIDALKGNNWDFLDAYSSRLFPGMNGTPGQSWPQFSTDPPGSTLATVGAWLTARTNVLDDRTNILRAQDSFVAYAQTREANILRLVLHVLVNAITRDPSLVVPTDR